MVTRGGSASQDVALTVFSRGMHPTVTLMSQSSVGGGIVGVAGVGGVGGGMREAGVGPGVKEGTEGGEGG